MVTSGASRHTVDDEDRPSNPLHPLTAEPARLGRLTERGSGLALAHVHHSSRPCKEDQQPGSKAICTNGAGLWERSWAMAPSEAASPGQQLLIPRPARLAGRRDLLLED